MSREAPDPRLPQSRIAATPTGRQVWVPITGDDRLAVIKALPGRWPEMVMARERGVPFDELAKRARCDVATFRDGLASAYTLVETGLHDLAQRRARVMV